MNQNIVSSAGRINAGQVLKNILTGMDQSFASSLNPIINFAKQLPAYSGNILEWHLDKSDHYLDFAYRLNAKFDRPLLATQPIPGIDSRGLNQNCLGLVDQQKAVLKFGIDNIWIEYDAPFQTQPALFFDIHREDNICFGEKMADVETVLNSFHCKTLTGLVDFIEKLEMQQLAVVYYGMMFSRKSKSTRLTINRINPAQLTDTLRLLGWDGDYETLQAIQARYFFNAEKIVLAVDFDKQMSQRIGIEVFNSNPWPLANLLREDKKLTEQQFQSLSAWEGKVCLNAPTAEALSDLHQRDIDCIYKRVNHFKFILDRTVAVTAKAYLYYCF